MKVRTGACDGRGVLGRFSCSPYRWQVRNQHDRPLSRECERGSTGACQLPFLSLWDCGRYGLGLTL